MPDADLDFHLWQDDGVAERVAMLTDIAEALTHVESTKEGRFTLLGVVEQDERGHFHRIPPERWTFVLCERSEYGWRQMKRGNAWLGVVPDGQRQDQILVGAGLAEILARVDRGNAAYAASAPSGRRKVPDPKTGGDKIVKVGTYSDARGISAATITGWIKECRELGLLAPRRRGRPKRGEKPFVAGPLL